MLRAQGSNENDENCQKILGVIAVRIEIDFFPVTDTNATRAVSYRERTQAVLP